MQKPIVPGTVVNQRYQIQKKIPDNASNCCYLTEDTSQSNRLVVLSFPRIELLILSGFAHAFKDACENLMSLRIDGLVKVLDNGLYDSQPYAVLQFLTHDALETSFKLNAKSDSKVSVDTVLDWATPLAVCLDELHKADFVHSNVRPNNIYLGPRQVFLGDFITEFTLQRMSKFKNAVSTLDLSSYLAPEYLKSTHTGRYDQYMLATLFYEALSNRTPFDRSKGGDDYRMQVATHVPASLVKYRPELSGVSDVLVKALTRNPLQRYPSCRDMISAIQKAQASPPRIVELKPAEKIIVFPAIDEEPEEEPEEPIITSIRNDSRNPTNMKGLLWVGIALIGGVAAAYTVLNQNGADQITSNKSSRQAPAGETVTPVTVTAVSSETATNIETSKTDQSESVLEQPSTLPKDKQTDEDQLVESSPVNSEPDAVDVKPQTENMPLQTTKNDPPAEIKQIAIPVAPVSSSQSPPSKSGIVVSDKVITGLSVAINGALKAGQEEFLESQQVVVESSEAVSEQASNNDTEQPDNEETVNAQQRHQELLNQELLAAQALVNQRETDESDRERTAKATEPAPVQFERTQGENTRTQNTVTASAEVSTTGVGSSETGVSPVTHEPEQPVLSEREKLRAFKEKETARIRAVTTDCMLGGKIHREAAAGNLGFVKSCLAVGVSPNIVQSNQWTPLHIAARSGFLNMSKLLLAKGASINAKSAGGLTPLDMAISLRQTQIADYLRSRGGVATR